MQRQINLGGKFRPIQFGHGMILEYEDTTGRLYLDDLETLRERLSAAYATLPKGENRQITEDDMRALGRKMPLGHLARFCFIALRWAGRRAGETLDFTQEDVLGWIMESPAEMATLVTFIIDSMQKTDDEPAPESAKKKPAGGSTSTS